MQRVWLIIMILSSRPPQLTCLLVTHQIKVVLVFLVRQGSTSWSRPHLLRPGPQTAGQLQRGGGAAAENCSAPDFIPLARLVTAQTDLPSSPSTAGWGWILAVKPYRPGWTEEGDGSTNQRRRLERSIGGWPGDPLLITDGWAEGKTCHVLAQ